MNVSGHASQTKTQNVPFYRKTSGDQETEKSKAISSISKKNDTRYFFVRTVKIKNASFYLNNNCPKMVLFSIPQVSASNFGMIKGDLRTRKSQSISVKPHSRNRKL